ncbi:Enamine deaminase RidA, house cleaning of reactive enamine intermediates, YjgF/YER057c/UK114 family [Cupriavidus sp. OV038]|jgi:enamine deaminase RidA (YjgF/YER057c/UK114 family)|uniref:RidA family protein n=1 Tax=unclassified Cupriavidus TaxID=2640874 RepID=UPI0008E9E309|nr:MULTISPECIES: RidA family protein [unclassified Cupriavidus]SFC58185.1 Enamine deaminase RidA, house cleaning of reactive enamine intermediates, YjgF/YER057c/UK114 family [Cupriavidus sp. OV038]SFP44707.1 Enamine deaminase RidA, house cleaning of reactive enamine intermediates, YjgF/YER057c/UK114 family [Cupriavidus sp. OV096]
MSTSSASPIVRLDQNHRRSRAVIANGMVFLAGQVADDKSGDIASQAREALAKVDALLAEAGTDRRRALTAQIWLADMADFDGFNAVWDAWVAPGETPTRCCGKVELADPAYRVEIVITALLA